MGIQFTDRYGGHSPAWIRSCFDGCEAMGWHPTKDQSEWPIGTRAFGVPEDDGTPDDGWRFVKCSACHGTGRVSWMVSILRIPRWIWKGIAFMFYMIRKANNPPSMTLWDRFKLCLWCSYGYDLTNLRR